MEGECRNGIWGPISHKAIRYLAGSDPLFLVSPARLWPPFSCNRKLISGLTDADMGGSEWKKHSRTTHMNETFMQTVQTMPAFLSDADGSAYDVQVLPSFCFFASPFLDAPHISTSSFQKVCPTFPPSSGFIVDGFHCMPTCARPRARALTPPAPTKVKVG